MNNRSINQTVARVWPFVEEPRAVFITRLAFGVLVALLGVCANVHVCFTITRQSTLRSAIRYYIRNLAVADIGILLLSFPLAIIKEQLPYHWPLGKGFCLYGYPMVEIFHGVSIWSIAAIACERYRYIAPNMRYARHSSLANQRFIIAAIWIVSFLVVSLPLFFVMKYLDYPELGQFCIINWPGLMHQIYNVVMIVFWYLLPLSMITLSYVQISRELRISNAFHKSLGKHEIGRSNLSKSINTHANPRKMNLNCRAKKILTPIVVLFGVTMFPINLLRIMVAFWEGFSQNRYFLMFFNVSVICVIINSAADPLIYYFATKDFVKHFNLPTKFRLFRKTGGARETSRGLIGQCPASDSIDMNLKEFPLTRVSTLGSRRQSGQSRLISPV